MRPRAFVLDDDQEIRSLITSILDKRGYEVLSFSEPRFCPVYLDGECPCPKNYTCADVFVSDNNMPNITGLEFVENQLRNDCKVIIRNIALMSGAWTDDELNQAQRLGCKIFSKPFTIAEIERWLDECEKRIPPYRKLSELPLLS